MAKPVHSPASRLSSPNKVTLLNAGRAALSTGAWSEAAEAFSRALELAPGPGEAAAEAWAGIGAASYWLGDGTTATSAYERAFREYRDLGRGRDAARMALWLTDIQFALFGSHAVANGWMEQASRLLATSSASVESLWLLAYRGHLALLGTGDAGTALELAREGQAKARALGATEVEVVTLALEGLARVHLGEVEVRRRPTWGAGPEAPFFRWRRRFRSPSSMGTTAPTWRSTWPRSAWRSRASPTPPSTAPRPRCSPPTGPSTSSSPGTACMT